jgi:hypothetical protein
MKRLGTQLKTAVPNHCMLSILLSNPPTLYPLEFLSIQRLFIRRGFFLHCEVVEDTSC